MTSSNELIAASSLYVNDVYANSQNGMCSVRQLAGP